MKPKPFLRLFILFVIASVSLLLFASSKNPIRATCCDAIGKQIGPLTEKASANEFIFVEALNKFLYTAISR